MELVADLADDRVSSNAVAAYATLLERATVAGEPDGDLEAMLVAALSSRDLQQRQFATALLIHSHRFHERPVRTWPATLLTNLVEALADDGLRGLGIRTLSNARLAADEIRRQVDSADGLSERLRDMLLEAIDGNDRQQRQYSAVLLVEAYRKAGVGPSQWPDTLVANVIAGLSDDNVHGAATFANARVFFSLLDGVHDPRIERGLEALVGGEDRQANLAALVLLADRRRGTAQLELARGLVAEMADDGHPSNHFAAFRALWKLGRGSVEAILATQPALDWQQDALVSLLAARFEISTRADPDRVLEWRRRGRSAAPSRIAAAAAYVLDDRDAAYDPAEPLPALVARMSALSRSLDSVVARIRWAATWFWFLDFENDYFESGWGTSARPF